MTGIGETPDAPNSARAGPILMMLALALAIRLIVAVVWLGSIDANLEVYHGELIRTGRSAWTSKLPIGYYLPAAMEWLWFKTQIPDHTAQTLPAIAGDLLAAFLLWRMSGRRLLWPAIYLFNPATVMLSAYHGNIDPLMAAAMLWAFELCWREKPLRSGFAAALAVGMKPTGLLTIPPLLLFRRGRWLLATAATITIVLICLVGWLANPEFARFLSTYSGPYGNWGFSLILRELDQLFHARLPGAALVHAVNAGFEQYGRWVLIAVFVAWGLFAWRRWRIDTMTAHAALIAATWLVFYVATPGWGAQYLSLVLPFLLFASVRLASIFIAAISPFLLSTYLYDSEFGKYAGQKVFGHLSGMPASDLALLLATRGFALVAWAVCAWLLWRLTVTRDSIDATM